MRSHEEMRAARYKALTRQARSYGYWLSSDSDRMRRVIGMLGWRLSRLAFRRLGKPEGALAWPLGLQLLFLNALEPPQLDAWHELPKRLMEILRLSAAQPRLHVDRAGLGYAALRLAEAGDRAPDFLPHAIAMGERYLSREGAEQGAICYTPGRHEVLIDTIGMLCPFMARLSRVSGDPRYARLAFAQMRNFLAHATDPASGWLHHGYDVRTNAHIGIVGWGRGQGWLLLGAVDMLLELPEGEVHDEVAANVSSQLVQLASVQRSDGHWGWRLTDAEAQADSSVSALVAYSLARLVQRFPQKFAVHQPMLGRAIAALDSVTTADGFVTQASGEATGAGAYSTIFASYPWALGPAVAVDDLCP